MNKEIILKLYEKYKSSSQILNSDDMLKKHNSFFPGIWSGISFKNINTKKIIFGLNCGIIFFEDRVNILFKKNGSTSFKYDEDFFLRFVFYESSGILSVNFFNIELKDIELSDFDLNVIRDLYLFDSNFKKSELLKKKSLDKKKELLNQKKMIKSKNDLIKLIDKNEDGKLDFIEGGDDFVKLLKNHQTKIIEIDRNYIQKFVKVSNYLKSKKENLQKIYSKLLETKKGNELEKLIDIIKFEIHSYNLILFNSINLINSIVEDDMITFYDIYEKFDKLNMFNSNWEDEVSKKLDEVNLNIVNLINDLNRVGSDIVNSIYDLSYITEESTKQITSKLDDIDSTLKFGNLINIIQTYQTYKINQNTKSLK
jgi:hypothetical protein